MVVVDGWETAYYTNFSGSSGHGPQPMVVSYASSPAAEVVYATTPLTDSPTASILAPGTCFRQIEFVGILKGTKHLALAEKFVDFMLGQQFQEDMPLQMYRLPGQPGGQTSGGIREVCPDSRTSPVAIDPAEIAANRDQWVQDWTQAVLH